MADEVQRLYPNSPAMWGGPPTETPLPVDGLAFYPASPAMWEGQLAAHEAELRRAAAGDADAARALAGLPAAVVAALARNPGAADSRATVDWLARRFPVKSGGKP